MIDLVGYAAVGAVVVSAAGVGLQVAVFKRQSKTNLKLDTVATNTDGINTRLDTSLNTALQTNRDDREAATAATLAASDAAIEQAAAAPPPTPRRRTPKARK